MSGVTHTKGPSCRQTAPRALSGFVALILDPRYHTAAAAAAGHARTHTQSASRLNALSLYRKHRIIKSPRRHDVCHQKPLAVLPLK